jgi:hypothetical protein
MKTFLSKYLGRRPDSGRTSLLSQRHIWLLVNNSQCPDYIFRCTAPYTATRRIFDMAFLRRDISNYRVWVR